MAPKADGEAATVYPRPGGRVRWAVCALLFFALTINYVDRQMISILKPTLQKEFGWAESDYANIVFCFQAAYAFGYVIFGHLIDRLGARFGYSLAAVIWGLAAMSHSFARSAADFMLARVFLGLGESGNFPAGLKATAEWFPRRERAFATGIFNAGANVGAIITPVIAPLLVYNFGWPSAFLFTGAMVFIWLGFWLAIYRRPREHKTLSKAELAHIESDPADKPGSTPWLQLLRHRETWAFAIGKFLTDPVWAFFLYWLPDFFARYHKLDLKTFGPPLVVIYIVSDFGSIGGGWLSGALIKRGWSVNAGRKTAMLICALGVLPIMFAAQATSLWSAVAIIALAAAAHQGWSANLYTLPSDTFPRRAVGSVIGIGGTLGAIGGMGMTKFAGWMLDTTGSYTVMFAVAASVYLLALSIIHLLTPRLAPARIDA